LGVYLAQQLRGEVISADSRQVYKGLDIGTGKVTKKEMQGVTHHLLDVVSPTRQFSVDEFTKKAHHVIENLSRNNPPTVPIIVGGTGLYIDVLLGRMSVPQVAPNKELREALEHKSLPQLFSQLKRLDPRRASTIEPHHKRRLIRAIEIAKALGASPTPAPSEPYNVLWLGILPDEETLRQNIRRRLLQRIKMGMIAEAQRLHKKGLSYKRMRELGLEYRFLADYLTGTLSKEEMLQGLERAIVHYAKRQKRWFVRNKNIIWVTSRSQALRLAKEHLRYTPLQTARASSRSPQRSY